MNNSEEQEKINSLLIIDDEQEILKSLTRIFRKEYKLFTAENADAAFELMNKNDIQVILSDQRMPGLTGSEFFDKVKVAFPDSMRLILTGFADIEAVIEAINRGNIFRYVTKPYNPTELKTIISEAFDRYWLSISNRKLLKDLKTANEVLEEKVLERTHELDQKNKYLKELNQEMNHFLGMAAHDLRNPIGIINGYSSMIMEDITDKNDPHLAFLEIINSQSNFMLTLLNDLLDVSKIEAGKIELRRSTSNYIAFVEQQVLLNAYLAKFKNIKFSFLKPFDRLDISFDSEKLVQVLNNLINNAIKYSEPNTETRIEVTADDKYVTTKVIDQGLGIPETELDNIFKPFGKTSVQPTNGEKSTGLGLMIVKKIIESHNGEVFVSSKVGEGSIFSFTLPLQSAEKSISLNI